MTLGLRRDRRARGTSLRRRHGIPAGVLGVGSHLVSDHGGKSVGCLVAELMM